MHTTCSVSHFNQSFKQLTSHYYQQLLSRYLSLLILLSWPCYSISTGFPYCDPYYTDVCSVCYCLSSCLNLGKFFFLNTISCRQIALVSYTIAIVGHRTAIHANFILEVSVWDKNLLLSEELGNKRTILF